GTAQKAIAALNEYFKRSKDPAPGYYLMGRLYYRQSDASNAERYLLQATQAAPNNPDFWAMLGHVYVDLQNGKRLVEGLACYEKALALRPQDWETLAALGRAEMQQQKSESAIAHLKSALQYAPDPGPLLYSLGQALLRGGHEEEGRRTLAEYQDYLEYSR